MPCYASFSFKCQHPYTLQCSHAHSACTLLFDPLFWILYTVSVPSLSLSHTHTHTHTHTHAHIDTAGCKRFMFLVNATAADATDTLDPVTLTCDPVGVGVDLSDASITWQRFTNQIEMDTFINSCTADGCSENCTGSTASTVTNMTGSIILLEYNLTINNPLSNHAWFIPTFQRENCTYIAPPTFLYRESACRIGVVELVLLPSPLLSFSLSLSLSLSLPLSLSSLSLSLPSRLA